LDVLRDLAQAAAAQLEGRRARLLLHETSGEIEYHATHDALTGLVNRSEFEARLRRALQKAREDRSQHALLYIDIDQFKLINDSCGHAIGDQLLQEVGKLFAESIRTRDTLARLGGDEFAIILEHCSAEQAQRVAQQICDATSKFRFTHDDRSLRVSASIGLVPVDDRWTAPAAILQAADASCYAAKEGGRNRVHLWFDTDTAIRVRAGEMQWAMRIEHALEHSQFVLYAQRIEELGARSRGVRAEALLRMVQDGGKLTPPGAFLPAAEKFHLASRIDRWVLQEALAWLKALHNPAVIRTLSINLSGQSIGDRAFHRHAIEAFREAGARICAQVCVEITETAAVTNMADAAVFIQRIRSLGVQVALDDFGAGASSFGYLKTLPVDYLKIDGQFVRDIVDDPLDEAAVRCFAEVARVVGVKTVAEFVDRPEVLAKLQTMGIDYGQGFLLHRPAPLDELLVQ
jgi:diguanylate cyclase (GGDEF)-like protein